MPDATGSVRNRMEIRVAVVGAGSWGTTVAALAEQIDTEHVNGRYLADFPLPPSLRSTSDLEEAVTSADVLVMAVPSHGFRAALEDVAKHLRPWVPVVSLAK